MSDQNQTLPAPSWSDAAAYEAYMGRWSRLVAPEFLDWLAIPSGSRWLDVGSGSGILSQTILNRAHPAEVEGIDPSAGFVAFAHENIVDERVHFTVGNAQQLPMEDSTFDVAVAGLVINFVPDQPKALSEMARVVKPGGVVAAYVWDYADLMQLTRTFWDAVIVLHPEAIEFEQGRRFPICKPEPLVALFEGAELDQVEVRSIDIPTHFRDFDDYWSPFLGGQGAGPTYMTSLSDQERLEIQNLLKTRLPINADGSIDLIARAWAVRGSL